jgi:hypothetical protein
MPTRSRIVVPGGLLSLVAVLSALFGVGTATAYAPPGEGWGAAYERAAVEYWGEEATRCEGTDVSFDSPVPAMHQLEQGEGRALGRATVASSSGQCYMWIAPLEGRGIYFRCILFAHEYGHWLGHADSPADPWRSVTAELLGEYTQDLPCHRLVAAVRSGSLG